MQTMRTQLAVIGGGPAGVCAALRGVQQSSERQFHIEADYFIDATGDGTVSAKAGVPFSVGNGNHETLGNSILYITPTICHILRRSSAAAGFSFRLLSE